MHEGGHATQGIAWWFLETEHRESPVAMTSHSIQAPPPVPNVELLFLFYISRLWE